MQKPVHGYSSNAKAKPESFARIGGNLPPHVAAQQPKKASRNSHSSLKTQRDFLNHFWRKEIHFKAQKMNFFRLNNDSAASVS